MVTRGAVLPLATLALVAACCVSQRALARTIYIECGRVLPVAGEPIESGKIVVRDGVIEEVSASAKRPPFSVVLDARGQTVTPGFVVPMTRLGMPSAADPPAGEGVRVALEPELKAASELDPRREALAPLLDCGITMVGVLPSGTQAGIPGQISAVLTSASSSDGSSVVEAEAALLVHVATHQPWRDAVSAALVKAGKDVVPPAERPRKERPKSNDAWKPPTGPLHRIVQGKEPMFAIASTPALLGALSDVVRGLEEHDIDLVVLDGPDLHLVAGELKELDARVVTWPVLIRERGTRMPLNRAAVFERAGVPFAFALPSDSASGALLLRDAAIEMERTGCSRAKVLEALTLEGARALGVEDCSGAIGKGLRADLLFWSGDPLDPTSRLERVMVGGELIDALPRASAP